MTAKNGPKALPRVVVAGRPNVGKSTLFNRLCRRRRSITDAVPGVTRDTVEEQCDFGGTQLLLVDTGGVKTDFDGDFDGPVADRALAEFRRADVILLVMEIGTLTAEDSSLVKELRPWSDKILLLVNKADLPEKDWQAAEFHTLGFGSPIPVSAAHGRNMDLLKDALLPRLDEVDRPTSEVEFLGLALSGRPNVGKSTLANRLAGLERSLVSEIPGTTRDTVVSEALFNGRRVRIIDTAGMRRKARVTDNVEYYAVNRAIAAMGEADVVAILVDADEGLSDQDKKIAAQAVKRGSGIVLTLNKWGRGEPRSTPIEKGC